MTDVWWGVVEKYPQQYNWTAYDQLAYMCQSVGLKMQVVMSFHTCGGNVGDNCNIPLPSWVLDVGNSNPDIFYKSSSGSNDPEYLSLGVDHQNLFGGRSAVQIYSDYMSAFASNFSSYFGNTIDQIQVGLGPAGEMRYPSYQSQDNRWTYCGVGEFQCSDKYMLANLANAADNAGHSDWGTGGPDNAGEWNSHPSDTGFFNSNGNNNYQSAYGQFFLGWYSQALLQHGADILGSAQSIFGSQVEIAAKVSGIHWWYLDQSHAAELTAGYYNTNGNNAYLEIARMLAKYGAAFDFTALEMVNQPGNDCSSAPEDLVQQTILAAQQAGVKYAGENALAVCYPGGCNQGGFDEIYKESTQYGAIDRFTFLRLTPDLLGNNWNSFVAFVNRMNSA
eukprot:TRINITY_DN17216_c0_g1_i1.p1 TRINITY_DN17216_c0_g1~~TRINITY_DN17216_c0_g1_i1.p1  ORF type:complete len:453 (-),score=103.49 TRINITY_DN17216_c0_g1_i1:49-1221(-)